MQDTENVVLPDKSETKEFNKLLLEMFTVDDRTAHKEAILSCEALTRRWFKENSAIPLVTALPEEDPALKDQHFDRWMTDLRQTDMNELHYLKSTLLATMDLREFLFKDDVVRLAQTFDRWLQAELVKKLKDSSFNTKTIPSYAELLCCLEKEPVKKGELFWIHPINAMTIWKEAGRLENNSQAGAEDFLSWSTMPMLVNSHVAPDKIFRVPAGSIKLAFTPTPLVFTELTATVFKSFMYLRIAPNSLVISDDVKMLCLTTNS